MGARAWRLARWLGLVAGMGLLGLVGLSAWIGHSVSGAVYRVAVEVPAREVGVVLGTAPKLRGGRPNQYFERRMDAAAELFRAGKVGRLIVSGAVHPGYDEPAAMRAALELRGVPRKVVSEDRVGLRTLDSILRARSEFGLRTFVVVTDEFHIHRALFIARHHGINAVGFAARDISLRYSMRARVRELLANVWVMLDLYVWETGPLVSGATGGLAPRAGWCNFGGERWKPLLG